jgi:DNA-binding transcriptional regulator of glucitol operon
VTVLFKPRWLALHVFTVFVVVTCTGLAWWQLVRAQAGNGRSFGYAMQWPAMAVFGIGVWVWLCRDGVRTARRGDVDVEDVHVFAEPPRAPAQVIDPEQEPELAAYNAMLAGLAERDAQQNDKAQKGSR